MFGKMMNSFYYGKSGKGDFRKEDLPKNRWQLFGEMLRVRFSALFRLNLMTVVAWLPLIYVIANCISTIFNVLIISSDYQTYLVTGQAGNLTEQQIAALANVDLGKFQTDMFLQSISQALIWCIPCILITGPVQAGMAYITRNWARDEHAFIWSDFKDAVKENWKQALGVSAITSVMPLLIYVCYQFYGDMARDNIIFMLPQMLVIVLGVLWCLGATFMYPMMVCYEMKFGALVKNSLMLAVARLPHTVGIRLVMLLPIAIAMVAFYLTGSMIAFLALGAYYLLFGYSLARFVFASFTNGVFDRFINSRMEGVKVNRGLASDDDLDDEEDEDESADDNQAPPADMN